MPDQRPPNFAAGERETLRVLLQFQRESLVRKVSGLDEEAANRSLVPSGTTLLWLVNHLAFAETLWLVHRFAGKEMDIEPEDTLAAAIDAYRATWARVDAIVSAADLDDLTTRNEIHPAVNLRWILAHLLEETARHAGHADILREQIDGETGR